MLNSYKAAKETAISHRYACRSYTTISRIAGQSGDPQSNLVRKVRVYVRDGFIDRYTGAQLVYPGALLLLKQLRPDLFCDNGIDSHSRPKSVVLEELTPKIDRIIPLHLGGQDDESNWITTSVRNFVSRTALHPSELQPDLHPQGQFACVGRPAWLVLTDDGIRKRTSSRSQRDRTPALVSGRTVRRLGGIV